MTHWRSVNVASRPRSIDGSATFTIVTSSSSMKIAVQLASSVHHLRSIGSDHTGPGNARTMPPVRLHYEEAGTGEPVLLVHGWPQHSGMWRHQIGPLSERFRVIAPD